MAHLQPLAIAPAAAGRLDAWCGDLGVGEGSAVGFGLENDDARSDSWNPEAGGGARPKVRVFGSLREGLPQTSNKTVEVP